MKCVITRACGHEEEIWVNSEDELKNKTTRRAHETELCEDCYVARYHPEERLMSYDDYKSCYGQYRTKANSYNAATREIVVFIP